MRIERPLFAKITANRVNFGNVLDVNLAGSHRPGISRAPQLVPQPQLANRLLPSNFFYLYGTVSTFSFSHRKEKQYFDPTHSRLLTISILSLEVANSHKRHQK